MLGPVDLDDWYDEDDILRGRLRLRPEYVALRKNPGISALPRLEAEAFALARRFSRDEILDSEEIARLARALGVPIR
jgi:hypothetical protein